MLTTDQVLLEFHMDQEKELRKHYSLLKCFLDSFLFFHKNRTMLFFSLLMGDEDYIGDLAT